MCFIEKAGERQTVAEKSSSIGGAQLLAQALAGNTTFQEIYLKYTGIQQARREVLMNAFASQNHALRAVDLAANNLGSEISEMIHGRMVHPIMMLKVAGPPGARCSLI